MTLRCMLDLNEVKRKMGREKRGKEKERKWEIEIGKERKKNEGKREKRSKREKKKDNKRLRSCKIDKRTKR